MKAPSWASRRRGRSRIPLDRGVTVRRRPNRREMGRGGLAYGNAAAGCDPVKRRSHLTAGLELAGNQTACKLLPAAPRAPAVGYYKR